MGPRSSYGVHPPGSGLSSPFHLAALLAERDSKAFREGSVEAEVQLVPAFALSVLDYFFSLRLVALTVFWNTEILIHHVQSAFES